MNSLKVISLFSGAGGLDYGFEAAGFDTAVALEFDNDCCETLRANRPHWRVIEKDIFDTPVEEILETADLREGDADVVIGGPPCQPFSKAGYWVSGDAKRLADPRANTLTAYLKVVEAALPRAFLLENVHGLAFMGKDEGLQFLLKRIGEINESTGANYQPKVEVLNAVSFGVPQQRERVFVVAARDGRIFDFPKPTHADMESVERQCEIDGAVSLKPYVRAWDAIGDLDTPNTEDLAVRGKWGALLPSIPEGNNYLWHTDRGGGRPLFGWRRRYWSFLLKLAKSRPSWTLQAQPGPAIGPFHWLNRRLSMRELCRLQTFPDNVHVKGNVSAVQRQVGNAVPSLLAEVLARAIRTQLLDSPQPVDKPVLSVPVADYVPPPEEPTDVPARYLYLEGKHVAHPGTGRGFGAVARGRNVNA